MELEVRERSSAIAGAATPKPDGCQVNETSDDVFDDPDQLVEAIAVVTCEPNELLSLQDDSSVLRTGGYGHPTPTTEVE
jgi:hypothetical protein